MNNSVFPPSGLKTFFLSVLFLLTLQILSAQPHTNFYRAWVSTNATLQPNFLNHVVTAAGSIGTSVVSYVAGSTLNTSGSYSMILTQYSSTGTALWNAIFDVNTAGNVHVGAITVDASNNILVTGSTYNGSTNNYDLFTVKYNSSGTKLWHQLYNGAGNAYDFGAAIVCASNGDVFVTGGAWQSSTNLNAVTIRYNSSGTTQWTQTWDNVGLTDACGTILLNSGYVVVTGFSQTNLTTWEYAGIRYDQSAGTLIGSNVTNQGGTTIEMVNAATLDNSGNIYITGAMGASGQQSNIKTIKLDASLNILWTATWNGAANKDDVGRGIAVDASGNVYVAGYTTGADDRDAVMLKYTSGGSQTWVQVYDAAEGDDEYSDLALTSSGESFVGGYVTQQGNKDFFAALYNASGSVRWSESYNGMYNKNDAIQQVTSDGSGNFLVAGPSGQSGGNQTIMTIKYVLHTLVKPQNEEVNAPFIENRGQTLDTGDDPVDNIRYYTRHMYPNVYIFGDKVSYVFAHIDTVPASQDTMTRIDLSFVATSAQVTNGRTQVAVGLERQEAFHNYYLGHIPEGRERVPLENKVLQPSIYDNIDALYGQGQDGLFIRFICKPGSSPSDIKLAFTGATALSVQGDGSLKVETALEDLVLPRPTAMTVSAEGTETAITAWQPSYSINSGVVSITTSSYDNTKTLVIKTGREREEEPCLVYWSTYYGDELTDVSIANEIDVDGFMYATGSTSSTKFPTQSPIQAQLNGGSDIFISRFIQPDILNWSTYYGGNNDIPNFWPYPIEIGNDIAADFFGNIYVVGRTSAHDFPFFVSGIYNDDMQFQGSWYSRGFIIRLSQFSGVPSWASYFGDPERQVDVVATVETLPNGNIIVGGFSVNNSTQQPQTPGLPIVTPAGSFTQSFGSAYIAELSSENAIIWSTKLGNGEVDQFYAATVNDVDVDDNGNLYLIGTIADNTPEDNIPSGSANLLTYGGGIDAYIMKFSATRSLDYSFFLGGSGTDWGNSINCVSDGYFVTGTTRSSNFPVLSTGNSDPLINDVTLNLEDLFVGKFTFAGVQTWMRFLGGDDADNQSYAQRLCYSDGCNTGGGAFTDEQGNLYIVGKASHTFPTVPPSDPANFIYYHPYINGYNQSGGSTAGYDAFLTLISNSSYNITFSTYWGGDNTNSYEEAYSVVAFSEGEPIVYFTGITNSNAPKIPLCFESDSRYYQDFNAGLTDGFQSKIYMAAGTIDLNDIYIPVPIFAYPNPTSNLLYVGLSEHSLDEIKSIVLTDITGKRLRHINVNQVEKDVISVDTSTLPSGYYICHIEVGNIIISKGFVKI